MAGCAPRCCCPPLDPCYKQPRIPDSYAPRRAYMRPTAPVEACTTYKLSYLPTGDSCNLRGIAIRPPPNLVPSCELMENSTIQRLSYLPNQACITQPIRPCHHDMWGQGPMQSITTQRHDYVPKPTMVTDSYKPVPKCHGVESPFENRTINRMSFLNPGCTPPTISFKPIKYYQRPVAKMDSATTHKMSYQMVCAQSPQRPPWCCRGQYQKPCQRLDSTTIYRSSYLPPGEDCTQRIDPCAYGDCKPCATMCPATCIATDPTHCTFPRAGC